MTKILLVEDDKSLREIYGVRLLAEGYDIVSAGDGEEALAMAIKDLPALILSDVMMPKISGFDMLDILRSTTETRNIKVIMMTALSSEDQRKRGEQLGADRYLVKSQVGIEDVVRTVHEVLQDSPIAANTSPQQDAGQSESSYNNQSQQASQQQPQPQPYQAATDRTAVVLPTRDTLEPQQQPQPQPQQQAYPSQNAPTPAAPQPTAPQKINVQQAPEPAAPLPQPTAPFSTPRQTNLAGRVIQPISTPHDTDKVSDMMQEELEAQDRPVQPSQDISSNDTELERQLQQTIGTNTPTQQPIASSQQQQPHAAPFSSTPSSNQNAAPTENTNGMSFEETSDANNTPNQQQ